MTAKQALLATSAAIDENASWEEAYAQLELRRRIDASEFAVEQGKWVSNDEILAEVDQWLDDIP